MHGRNEGKLLGKSKLVLKCGTSGAWIKSATNEIFPHHTHQTVFLSQLKSFGRLGQKINISTRFTLCTLVTFEQARSWKWQIRRGNFCVMSLWQIAMGSDKTQDASFENLMQNVVFFRKRNNSTKLLPAIDKYFVKHRNRRALKKFEKLPLWLAFGKR